MKHITAIEKLESIFFNEASPTINSHSWVIGEATFRRLIENAKQLERQQIIDAYCDGNPQFKDCGEEYYDEAYKK